MSRTLVLVVVALCVIIQVMKFYFPVIATAVVVQIMYKYKITQYILFHRPSVQSLKSFGYGPMDDVFGLNEKGKIKNGTYLVPTCDITIKYVANRV